MQEKELSLVVWSWGILLSLIGFFTALCGSIFMLLLKRHRDSNNSDHAKFEIMLKDIAKESKRQNDILIKICAEHELLKGGCGK